MDDPPADPKLLEKRIMEYVSQHSATPSEVADVFMRGFRYERVAVQEALRHMVDRGDLEVGVDFILHPRPDRV